MPASVYDFGGFIGHTPRLADETRNVLSTGSAPTYVGGTSAAGTLATFYAGLSVSLSSLAGGSGGLPQEGDLVVVVTSMGATSTAAPVLQSYVSGYTQLLRRNSSDTYSCVLHCFYKVMGSTPDSSVLISNSFNSSSYAMVVAIHVWRGVDPANPVLQGTTTRISANSSIANPPAILPHVVNSVPIVMGSSGHALGSVGFSSIPSPITNIINLGGTNTTYDTSLAIGSMPSWTSGIIDPGTFTQTTNTSYSFAAATFAISPIISYGNRKNSGIWSLSGDYKAKTSKLKIYDSFTDSDLSSVFGHTPDTTLGKSGYVMTSTIANNPLIYISGGKAVGRSVESVISTGGGVIDCGITDVIIEADISRDGTDTVYGGTGIVFRSSSDGENNYLIDISGTSMRLRRFVGLTATLVASATYTLPSTGVYRLKVEALGNTVKAYIDNALILNTTIDGTYYGNTYHGFGVLGLTSTTGSYVDNFSVSAF